MRAEDVRNMMNHSAAIDYIIQAANRGKNNTDIPKGVVNRSHLESLGYKVGNSHQRSSTINVSWREIEDRRGG